MYYTFVSYSNRYEIIKKGRDNFMGRIIKDGVMYAGGVTSAKSIKYDNSVSGLDATNIKEAIDKLAAGDAGAITLTQAEFDALSEEEQNNGTYYITDDEDDFMIGEAELIYYDNTNSGLEAEDVQGAVDEIANGYLPLSGGTLTGKSIYFNNGMGTVYANDVGNISMVSHAAIQDDWVNCREFALHSMNEDPNIANALDLVSVVDGSAKFYKIYGEHNKDMMPFLPLEGGTLTGYLGFGNSHGLLEGFSEHVALMSKADPSTSGANMRAILLRNSNATDLVNALMLQVKDANSVQTNYRLYGEHNYPILDNTETGHTFDGVKLITANALKVALNRTVGVSAAETNYSHYKARGIALVTSAPSSLNNGCCAFVYQ